MFYKGYIETKNKEAIEQFKGKKKFKTLEDVQGLSEYAGVLAQDTILVDLDDFEQSEILLKIVQDFNLVCRVYKTTRGKHFLFQNNGVTKCGTHLKLAIGLEADIKIGLKNSYEVIKFGGVDREILYDTATDENAQPLPKWLRPLNKSTDVNFHDMEVGDGRNQALFNYILTLQSNDYSKDEARETIRILNKYVLKDPLKDSELETILRDDAFKKALFFQGSTFLFDRFGNYLISEKHIIKVNNQIHAYNESVYLPIHQKLDGLIVSYAPNLPKAKRAEVIAYLEATFQMQDNTPIADAQYIAFQNGVLDIENGELLPHSPDIVITNKIPWDYDPNANSELVQSTLNKISCNDAQIRALLEEMIGYCFYRSNVYKKAFLLTGDGDNGKSTLLDVIKALLGDDNTCALDLKELGDRFKTAEMFGKLANIGDDISDEFLQGSQVALFKKVTSGNRISAERKGRDPFEFDPYVKLLLSANEIPHIKDRTGAVQNRLIIIPFNARFSASDPDYNPRIKWDLQTPECMKCFIRLGVEGLKRVLSNKGFSKSSAAEQATQDYEQTNNPIKGFFAEKAETDGEDYILRYSVDDIYTAYQEYSISNGINEYEKKVVFGKVVCKMFSVESYLKKVGKKPVRMYRKRV